MALDNYADLKTSVAGWLNRRDLDAMTPDFIRLAEDDINTILRCREQETTVQVTAANGAATLPANWLEMIRLAPDDGMAMKMVTPERMQELVHTGRATFNTGAGVGAPTSFAVVGTGLEVWPRPASVVLDLTYYAKVPRLSDAAPTNWLLAADAAIYLYGALAQSAPYLKNDARIATWAALYKNRVETRNAAARRAAVSGGALRRVRRGF